MIEVFVDGSARGQGQPQDVQLVKKTGDVGQTNRTGEGAVGVAIYENKKLIGQFARGLGQVTNNRAEYEATLMGIMLCWAADLRDPIVYSDSKLVVKQVTGEWECKNASLRPLWLSIKEIQEVFRFRIVHVPRNVVWEADALANLFLNKLLNIPED